MGEYKDKKAVIIGGTSGMGYAIVEQLAKGGARLVLTGRNTEKLQEAEATYPNIARGLVSDIASKEDRAQLAEFTKATLGTIDYLFVNTGVCEIETWQEITEESYDRQFEINTKGAFFTIQSLLPLMNDGGAIIFTSSIADKMGIPGMLVYSATKAALVSMTQVLAAELMPRKIRVNAVSVGYANTPSMGVAGFSAEQKQAFADDGNKYTPMGRIATVEEFATTAVFLAHDATFVTGVNMPLDGGIGLGIFAQQ